MCQTLGTLLGCDMTCGILLLTVVQEHFIFSVSLLSINVFDVQYTCGCRIAWMFEYMQQKKCTWGIK